YLRMAASELNATPPPAPGRSHECHFLRNGFALSASSTCVAPSSRRDESKIAQDKRSAVLGEQRMAASELNATLPPLPGRSHEFHLSMKRVRSLRFIDLRGSVVPEGRVENSPGQAKRSPGS